MADPQPRIPAAGKTNSWRGRLNKVWQRLLLLSVILPCLAATGCVTRTTGNGQTAGQPAPQHSQTTGATALARFVLLRTDLGLGDGEYIRGADAALSGLAQQGKLTYQGVGALPKPLSHEAGAADVGLPVPHSANPGEMTLSEAEALLAQAPPCDVLVISSGYLLPHILEQAAQHKVQAQALLLLDEQGMGPLPAKPPLPVFRLRYDIKPMAQLAGIAAAASTANAQFGVLYAQDDPQGEEFAKAVAAGAKHHSNGAWTEMIAVPSGPDGFIGPSQYGQAYQTLRGRAGPNWKPERYIVCLGRSTPTIMNALSKKPTLADLVGAYADYRAVRPASVVGCVLKQPGTALQALLNGIAPAALAHDPVQALATATKDGIFMAGLEQKAVDFTDFSEYARYNDTADDVAAQVKSDKALIRTGEIGIKD